LNISIIVVGHSMGGSIATKAVNKIFEEKEKYKFHSQIKCISLNNMFYFIQ